MTIEESIQVLCANVMVAVDRAEMSEACSKMVEDALNMAIASLEAWGKVREEIVHLHDWAFDREEILRIIDKHLQEVTE